MAYEGPIDINRGVMYCTVPGYPNYRVFMYIDTPGEYFDGNGNPVPEEAAKAAGFQTERYKKQHILNKEKKKFEELMRDQLKMTDVTEIYREKDGLRIVHYPETGMAYVERDGQRLYDTPVPLSSAVMLFDMFVKGDNERAEEPKAEPGIAKSTEAAPSPPPTSPSATKGAKVGAAAMLK